MADLDFRIDRPAPSAVVGRKITISGLARTIHGDGYPRYLIFGVRVALGDGGPVLTAQFDHGTWTCLGSLPDRVPGGSPVTITATVHGMKTVRIGGPDTDPITRDEPFAEDERVVVTLDGSVPEVTIEPIPSQVKVEPGELYVLDLSGTAGDPHTAIRTLQLKVDDEPFRRITDVVDTGGGRLRWSRRGLKLTARAHQLIVRAIDGAGNIGDDTAGITVQEPVAPGVRDRAFEPHPLPVRARRLRAPLRQDRWIERRAHPGHARRPLPPAVRPAHRAGLVRAGDRIGVAGPHRGRGVTRPVRRRHPGARPAVPCSRLPDLPPPPRHEL